MISGTQSFSPLSAGAGAGAGAANSESKIISTDGLLNNSEDFEILDSPRNSASSSNGGAAAMKALEAKKGSSSTIVKPDYSDASAVKLHSTNTNADFSNLNNINIVKVLNAIISISTVTYIHTFTPGIPTCIVYRNIVMAKS